MSSNCNEYNFKVLQSAKNSFMPLREILLLLLQYESPSKACHIPCCSVDIINHLSANSAHMDSLILLLTSQCYDKSF